MVLKDVIGHEDIKKSLINFTREDKLGHAYIFCGPKGIGKKTLARSFAGLLLCETGNVDCSCKACQLFENGSNPDFHFIEPEGKSIGVDDIRNIQSEIILRPMYSKRKVFIIADGDKMTVQAQNSLLKTLEEPPSYAVIIITASNYEMLLETIRSRAIRLSLKGNTKSEVYDAVINKFGNDVEGMEFIINYANGNIGTAYKLAESNEFLTIRDKTTEILLKLADRSAENVFGHIKFFEENKEDIDFILDIMLLFYRDLLILKAGGNENMLINSDKKDMIIGNAKGLTIEKLAGNVDVLEQARKNIKYNANYQLAIEVMLMKLQEAEN